MTRDDLKSLMYDAGLTRAQVAELLPAADAYATSQAGLALGSGYRGVPPVTLSRRMVLADAVTPARKRGQP